VQEIVGPTAPTSITIPENHRPQTELANAKFAKKLDKPAFFQEQLAIFSTVWPFTSTQWA